MHAYVIVLIVGRNHNLDLLSASTNRIAVHLRLRPDLISKMESHIPIQRGRSVISISKYSNMNSYPVSHYLNLPKVLLQVKFLWPRNPQTSYPPQSPPPSSKDPQFSVQHLPPSHLLRSSPSKTPSEHPISLLRPQAWQQQPSPAARNVNSLKQD